MILIDSNVPMYLVGAEHPHKVDARRLLERVIADRQRLVTDAEVLQEILHRYVAIDRRDAIQPALDALLGIVDEVIPIEDRDVLRARDVVLGVQGISARDALHVAIMQRHRIVSILSFDRGFDAVPGVRRMT
ncbi:MAG: type II toxin-antitoxin system VapC family toxin [Deltaproteobacteria bacterium]|nr:type II toxin-antitoxin system VapC family toxin [Deltaproteobacteria bacterium]